MALRLGHAALGKVTARQSLDKIKQTAIFCCSCAITYASVSASVPARVRVFHLPLGLVRIFVIFKKRKVRSVSMETNPSKVKPYQL